MFVGRLHAGRDINPPTYTHRRRRYLRFLQEFDSYCMSLITKSQSSHPTLVLHPRTWNETSFQENLVVIALAFALYGMLNLFHSD